ncbi:MAG TPA: right-handed parallel beta-helix repeat-containing protein, partial [Tepidisphaeraceae bacterium]|nr:right-handed parallel beta-helix repeat-containing protein [Tepidisphaeraceae bacterium]
MIRNTLCIAMVLALVSTATAAKGPVTDQQYTSEFTQLFQKRSSPVALKDVASVQLYDSCYMGHSLDDFLASNLQELGGDLAWSAAYRMISLNDMFRVTHDPKYLQANLRCTKAVLAVRDDHTGTKSLDGKALPAWSTARYTAHRTVFLVHTAMIVYPMLDAIELAKTSSEVPAETKAQLEKLLPEILRSLHLFDLQWRDGPAPDEGYYVGHDQEPALDGKPLPVNRLSAMGRCLWTTWLITKDPQYRTKAIAVGWYIKHRLPVAEDGAYYWSYSLNEAPVSTKPFKLDRVNFTGEDTSHATLSVSFPIMLAQNHEVFNDQDMRRFAKTITDGWARLGNGVLFGDINGSPRSNPAFVVDPAGWLPLAAYDPAVKAHILPFYLDYKQRFYPSYKQNGRPEALASLLELRKSEASDADPTVGRTFVVDQRAANATDDGPGTAQQPFKTISKAASLAGPGDTVLVHAGLYREWVAPARGGEEGKPVTYEAAEGEKVTVSGSKIYHGKWTPVAGHPGVYSTIPPADFFMDGFDPFEIRLAANRGGGTQGQVFFDGKELAEAIGPHTYIEGTGGWKLAEPRMQALYEQPGTWWTEDGKTILVHMPDGAKSIDQSTVEFSVRRRLFGPVRRCQNYIILRGFIFEHCADPPSLPQVGAVSCRSGQHWIIEDNTIQNIKSVGLDCGGEGYSPSTVRELPDTVAADRFLVGGNDDDFTLETRRIAGRDLILNNHISDCGQCGIAGLFSDGSVIAGNVIERCGGVISGFESAGIKIHGLMHGIIEGNLVKDCDSFGIWLDCGWTGSRITRNVVVNDSP